MHRMECAAGSEGGSLATDVDALRLLVQGPEVATPCAICRPEVVLRGRSAMSGWINSTSMGGAFNSGFSGKCRLLDKDPYWVDFPAVHALQRIQGDCSRHHSQALTDY
ncbi:MULTISPECIES: hypothetical protein [Streptomyces]|uniref:hypothetical protein n=1 Tax=Streptomyces TaxID=1883 RepID=UPI0006B272DD